MAKRPTARKRSTNGRRYGDILYQVKDQVAWVTINRPRVLNALDRALSAELAEAAESAAADPDVWVVVVRGAGRAFCSGMDRTVLSAGGIDEAFYRNWIRALNVLEDMGIREGIKAFSNWPTIPQLYVKGEFVGGCDIVREMFQEGELQQLLDDKGIAYDKATMTA